MGYLLAEFITSLIILMNNHRQGTMLIVFPLIVIGCAYILIRGSHIPNRSVKPHNDFREDDIYNGKSDRI